METMVTREQMYDGIINWVNAQIANNSVFKAMINDCKTLNEATEKALLAFAISNKEQLINTEIA